MKIVCICSCMIIHIYILNAVTVCVSNYAIRMNSGRICAPPSHNKYILYSRPRRVIFGNLLRGSFDGHWRAYKSSASQCTRLVPSHRIFVCNFPGVRVVATPLSSVILVFGFRDRIAVKFARPRPLYCMFYIIIYTRARMRRMYNK